TIVRPPCSSLFPYTTLFRSEVVRVVLRDDRLAEQRGGDGDAGFLDQREQAVLQPEAVDFDARDDDRAFGGAQHGGGFLHGLAERDRKSTRLNSSHVKISYAV